MRFNWKEVNYEHIFQHIHHKLITFISVSFLVSKIMVDNGFRNLARVVRIEFCFVSHVLLYSPH